MIKTVDALPLTQTAALEARARKVIPLRTGALSEQVDDSPEPSFRRL